MIKICLQLQLPIRRNFYFLVLVLEQVTDHKLEGEDWLGLVLVQVVAHNWGRRRGGGEMMVVLVSSWSR